ncbi:EI24 domain-containing protein [Altibacter sp.]|uniref:EI24 domain-containing protein n=1 Tax=Altibacter sp. TaxID=2024823 RepID=UPI000C9457C7|nr:EI24 domain-containing protein [Altibacter sp.]MAP53585.1 coproporphyrinogen III oxidase [Altibacter sp.]
MIRNVLKGIQAYRTAWPLINKLNLWQYFAVPMVISFLTGLLIGFAAWGLSDDLGAFFSLAWVWEWGADVVRTISEILAAMLIVALGLILYKHIVMAVSAPFMSPVSEKIETHLMGTTHTHRNTTNASQLWRGIRINIRNLGMELLLTVPILLLSLIPVIGVVATLLLFLVQAFYAGFGNMDYTLERHLSYAESVRIVKQHRGIAVGNGIVFMAMLFIPVIGIILVLPLSVTAASTETIAILKETRRLAPKEPTQNLSQ